jgi:hypothetical protein
MMEAAVGVFASREAAERGAAQLGVAEERVSVVSPETEGPGTGAKLGGVVGGALGAATGGSLGAVAASLMVPGVGPVIATGVLAALLFGAGGAVIGASAGEEVAGAVSWYEDALRRGRSLVIVAVDDEEQARKMREKLRAAGAESECTARW